jgi:hypothetical protein
VPYATRDDGVRIYWQEADGLPRSSGVKPPLLLIMGLGGALLSFLESA